MLHVVCTHNAQLCIHKVTITACEDGLLLLFHSFIYLWKHQTGWYLENTKCSVLDVGEKPQIKKQRNQVRTENPIHMQNSGLGWDLNWGPQR